MRVVPVTICPRCLAVPLNYRICRVNVRATAAHLHDLISLNRGLIMENVTHVLVRISHNASVVGPLVSSLCLCGLSACGGTTATESSTVTESSTGPLKTHVETRSITLNLTESVLASFRDVKVKEISLCVKQDKGFGEYFASNNERPVQAKKSLSLEDVDNLARNSRYIYQEWHHNLLLEQIVARNATNYVQQDRNIRFLVLVRSWTSADGLI